MRGRTLTSPVTHFEIYGEEPAALARSTANSSTGGSNAPRAWTTGGSRPKRRRGARSGIAGGLTYRPIVGTRGWMHHVHVAALDDAVAEAERLGAAVLRPKTAVPKAAWYAVLADPEGNIFAVWQGDANAMATPQLE